MLQVYRVCFTILPNKNNFRSVLYLLWTWLEFEHNSSPTTLKIKRSNHRQLRMEKGKEQHPERAMERRLHPFTEKQSGKNKWEGQGSNAMAPARTPPAAWRGCHSPFRQLQLNRARGKSWPGWVFPNEKLKEPKRTFLARRSLPWCAGALGAAVALPRQPPCRQLGRNNR